MITTQELLNLSVAEGVTLKDVLVMVNGEGQFGTYSDADGLNYSMGDKEGFYEQIADRIGNAVIQSLIAEIDAFAGDPSDIAQWLKESTEE